MIERYLKWRSQPSEEYAAGMPTPTSEKIGIVACFTVVPFLVWLIVL